MTKEEIKEYKRKYYLANKERLAQKNKKWRDENKELKKKSDKEYREKNSDKLKSYHKDWSDRNKDKTKIIRERYRSKEDVKLKRQEYSVQYNENNKDLKSEYQKKYYAENKESLLLRNNEYRRLKREIEPLYRLTGNIRTLINKSIKRGGYTKKSRTFEILGCSFEEFKNHLESKFESWMTWDNYGLYNGELNYGWDIDHIIPVSSSENEEGVIALNHYTNLQPLCSKINRDIKTSNILN